MASPQRDERQPSAGKLLRADDSIFDLSEFLADVADLLAGSGIPVSFDTPGSDTPSSGQKTVTTAGTAVPLAATSTPVKEVQIKALYSNGVGTIYVGDSSVDSSTGYELVAGDDHKLTNVDLNEVYIDSSANGLGVSYVATA